jgi:hypothetical protein
MAQTELGQVILANFLPLEPTVISGLAPRLRHTHI